MAESKVHLNEKGFGSSLKGAASIVANEEGKPLTMRLTQLPNGAIGGCLDLISPEEYRRERVKSFFAPSAWLLVMERKVGNLGSVYIKHYTGTVIDQEYGTMFSYTENNGKIQFISSFGMPTSEEAKELLTGLLWNAVQACLQRSFDPMPDRLYYGRVAIDADMVIMHYHKDKLKMLADKA